MMDWLKVCNEAKIILFIKAIDKTHKQYYPDEIDMLKDAVNISGIPMTYVLNKLLKMKQPGRPPLSAPRQPCGHKCTEWEAIPKHSCEECKKIWNNCIQSAHCLSWIAFQDELIPSHMCKYETKTRRKMIHETKTLLGVMPSTKILLYSPMLK